MRHSTSSRISFLERRLSFVDGFHNPDKVVPVPGVSAFGDAVVAPSFINHDYLVLEASYGDKGEKLFMRAEKSDHPPEKAGIILTVDPRFQDKEESVRLFTIQCMGKEIGLPKILAIPTDHNPEYSL